MRKRIFSFSFLIVMTLLLAGCGKTEVKKTISVEEKELTKNAVVMTVNKESVTYEEMMAYIYFLKNQYEPEFGSSIWDYKIEPGWTMEDVAKESLISLVLQIKVIVSQADKEGITLDNDEKAEMNQLAYEFVESVPQADKEKYFISNENIEKIYQENQLATKMFYLSIDEADTEVTDEEAQQVKVQYIQILTNGKDRNGMEISMDEETKKKAKERAKNLLKSAKQLDSFGTFANQNSDMDEYEVLVDKNDKTHEKVFVDAAFSLKTGEFSQVIEGENGYYILYCVSNDDSQALQARKEAIIAQRQDTVFKEKYDAWRGDCKIDISNLFWENATIE